MLLQMLTYKHFPGFSENDHVVDFIFTLNIPTHSYFK